MRIINFETSTGPRVGAQDGDAVVDFRGRDDVRPVEVRFRGGVVFSWRELE